MPDETEMRADVSTGVGRHPCPGMRFAKLENSVIVAFFLAYFDEIRLTDARGKPVARVPDCNINNHSSHKPDEQILLKYKLRNEAAT